MSAQRKPVTELTNDELGREWEGWLWGDSVQGLTEEQSNRCIEVEREMDRREKETPGTFTRTEE